MKENIKSYLSGFSNGFGCISNFWEKPKFENINNKQIKIKSIIEKTKELDNKAWYQTCFDLRQSYDKVTNKYKNE